MEPHRSSPKGGAVSGAIDLTGRTVSLAVAAGRHPGVRGAAGTGAHGLRDRRPVRGRVRHGAWTSCIDQRSNLWVSVGIRRVELTRRGPDATEAQGKGAETTPEVDPSGTCVPSEPLSRRYFEALRIDE